MTQRQKLWTRLGILAPFLLAALGWGGGAVKNYFATKNELRDHVTAEAKALSDHSAVEDKRIALDSATHRATEARVDTSLALLIRACRRRGECP